MTARPVSPIATRILDELAALGRAVVRVERLVTDLRADVDALDRRLAPYGDGTRRGLRDGSRRWPPS